MPVALEVTLSDEEQCAVVLEMRRRGLSQVVVAGALGISQSVFSEKLAGKRSFRMAEIVVLWRLLDLGKLLALDVQPQAPTRGKHARCRPRGPGRHHTVTE